MGETREKAPHRPHADFQSVAEKSQDQQEQRFTDAPNRSLQTSLQQKIQEWLTGIALGRELRSVPVDTSAAYEV
jgi:hypothetical protein